MIFLRMELKGEVSASLSFLESAVPFQEDIREYADKYNSVKESRKFFFFFLFPCKQCRAQKVSIWLTIVVGFFLGKP